MNVDRFDPLSGQVSFAKTSAPEVFSPKSISLEINSHEAILIAIMANGEGNKFENGDRLIGRFFMTADNLSASVEADCYVTEVDKDGRIIFRLASDLRDVS